MTNAYPSRVDVLIPAKTVTGLTLESLGRLFADDPDERVRVTILLDGKEKDWGVDACEALFPHRVTIMRSAGPSRGPARGRNLLAKVTYGEYLVFVDSDVLLPTQFLTRLFEIVDDCPVPVVVAPHIRPLQLKPFPTLSLVSRFFSRFILGPAVINERLVVPSTVLAMPRSLWDRSGGFSEDFSKPGGEDTEWMVRNNSQNPEFKVRFSGNLSVWHRNPRSVLGVIRRALRYGRQDSLLSRAIAALPSAGGGLSELAYFDSGVTVRVTRTRDLFDRKFVVSDEHSLLLWRGKVLVGVRPNDVFLEFILLLVFHLTYLCSKKWDALFSSGKRGAPEGRVSR